jgi:hypothetical protein
MGQFLDTSFMNSLSSFSSKWQVVVSSSTISFEVGESAPQLSFSSSSASSRNLGSTPHLILKSFAHFLSSVNFVHSLLRAFIERTTSLFKHWPFPERPYYRRDLRQLEVQGCSNCNFCGAGFQIAQSRSCWLHLLLQWGRLWEPSKAFQM